MQFLGLFNLLTIKGCSETGLFTHLTNHVFRSLQFRKYIIYEGHLFFRSVQKLTEIWDMLQKVNKKKFCFLDCYSWIGCGKLVLLWREYLSSAVNVLTNTPTISDITKTDIFQINSRHSNETTWCKWLSKGVLKRGFLIYGVSEFTEFLISEMHSLLGSHFHSNCSKFDVDFPYASQNWENICCFLDNCIWIGCRKCFLLRWEYLSS